MPLCSSIATLPFDGGAQERSVASKPSRVGPSTDQPRAEGLFIATHWDGARFIDWQGGDQCVSAAS